MCTTVTENTSFLSLVENLDQFTGNCSGDFQTTVDLCNKNGTKQEKVETQFFQTVFPWLLYVH